MKLIRFNFPACKMYNGKLNFEIDEEEPFVNLLLHLI